MDVFTCHLYDTVEHEMSTDSIAQEQQQQSTQQNGGIGATQYGACAQRILKIRELQPRL